MEITATTNEMNTFLIAQALMPSESAEVIVWVFEQVAFNDMNIAYDSCMNAFSIMEGFLPP
jgi:hypothetical protein